MYHTDDLLRKHHLLIDDGDETDGAPRLVDWETHEPAHPDAALAYLGELAHGARGFPGEDIAAALLEWVATLPRPADGYVRKEPNPHQCFACGSDDHARCGCAEHYEIIDRMKAYRARHDDSPKDEAPE